MSDTHELRQIAQTIESNGGWHIAAIKVRAAADELDALAAENERLREAHDKIRGAVACCRDGMQGAHRNLWEALNDAFPDVLAKEPTT